MGLELVSLGAVLGGRYEVRAVVRSTPNVRVWEAFDPVLDREVIIETLDPRCTGEIRSAFLESALRSARCSNHGVLRVYDTGNENGTAYVVSELVRGDTLDQRIAAGGPMPVGLAAALACEASDALAGAHRDQLFHGALRTSCIVITDVHRVKIGGFGSPPGADQYCAPELQPGDDATELGDVYAMAVCTMEMLTGAPFDPRSQGVSDALAARPDVPLAMRNALERALDPDPTTRAAHVRAIHRACAPFRIDPTPPPTAPLAVPVVPAAASAAPTEAVPVVPEVATTAVPVTPAAPSPAAASAEPAPVPIGLDPGPRPRRFRSTLILLASLIAMGFLIGVVGVVILTSKQTDKGSATTPAAPIPIASITDYDPFGDNGQEGHQLVANAADGSPATAWSTETYESATFGNTKPGVGLRVRLARSARVRSVVVNTAAPGWSASVYPGSGTAVALADWGAPSGTIIDAPTNATIAVSAPSPAPEVLIWFTRLPASGRLDVTEVQVLG